MKKIILLFVLFFCLSANDLMAQNSFMGKRFLVNADIVVSPSYFNRNFWGGQGYLAFNYMISPNIEIIVWKKGTAGITGHFFNSQYRYNFYTDFDDGYYWGSYSDNKHVPFNVFGYGLYYKQYFKNTRAPMGPYVKFQFDFLHPQYFEKPGGAYAFVPGAKFEMGNDYLFFNRLRLSFGVSLGMTFKGMIPAMDKHGYYDHKESAMGRTASVYWLGFKMGIGILAF